MTAIEIMARLCEKPASTRQTIAVGTVCICTNSSSVAYHSTVAAIISRATRMPPTRLSTIEPASEPIAKLADR